MDQNKTQSEKFIINVHGGNVQINPDIQNSAINQNNYNSNLNEIELLSLIEAVQKSTPSNLGENETAALKNSLSAIKSELSSIVPKKSILRNAIDTLKAIKGTAEFAAAVATLVQFIQVIVTN